MSRGLSCLRLVAAVLLAATARAGAQPAEPPAPPLQNVRGWSGLDALRLVADTRPLPGTLIAILEPHRRADGGAIEWAALRFDGREVTGLHWPAPPGAANAQVVRCVQVDGSTREESSAPLEPDRARALGLTGDLHLVRVQVNAGRGSGGGPFLATDVEVLDGTPAFAGAPADLQARVQGELAALPRDALTGVLARAHVRLLRRFADLVAVEPRALVQAGRLAGGSSLAVCRPPRDGPTPAERAGGALVTSWRGPPRVLEILAGRSVERTYLGGELRRRDLPCPPCPCDDRGNCAPCVRCLPRWTISCRGAVVRAEEALRVRFDARGRAVRRTHLAPRIVARTTEHDFEGAEEP